MGKTKLLAAGVAVAAMTLAGCGGTAPGVPGVPGSAPTASAPTGDSGGGSSSGTAFDSLKALSDAVTEGSTNAQSAHMKFSSTAGGVSMEGEGDFNFAGDKTAMQMKMSVPGEGEITMRFVENIIYMKMPGGQELEPGKPWVKIDLSKGGPMAEAMGGSIDQAQNTDPRQMLQQLAESGSIKGFEADDVNGKPAQKYTIEVELSKLGEKDLGMDKEAIAQLEAAGVKNLTYQVWVDKDNLPLRFVTEVPVMGQKVQVQADYSDWGKPVDVSAPPASQVAELPY